MPAMFPLPTGSPFATPEVSAPAPMFTPPPAAPVPPPSFAPAMPPMPMQAQPHQPSFIQSILPVAAAFLAGGGKDPAAMGQGMAAYMRGRQLRQQQNEHDHDRAQRDELERAEFYGRMLDQAQQFDDPVAFERWKQAVEPVAQVHGLSTSGLVFNDAKKQAKDTKTVQSAVDAAVKLHGPEILNRTDVSLSLPDGRQVSMPVARGLIGGTVTAAGKAVPVPDSTKTPTPRQEPMAGSFEDYVTRTYGEKPTPAQILQARKDYQQADDRPRITVNTGAADSRTNTRIDRAVTAFNGHPIVKEFNEVQAQQALIQNLANGRWSGPGDMSIVFAFMKALDPNSVVRESEYDNAAKSGNIFSGWAAKFNGMLSPSGGFLSPQVKRDFLTTISGRMQVKKQQYDNLRKQMAARIDRIRSGAPETGDEALVDYGAAIPDKSPEAASGLSKLAKRKKGTP